MKRTILTTAAICTVLMLGVPAMATDYTWTGANNTDWHDPNNWLDPVPQINGYPDGTDDTATIPDVSGTTNRFPIVTTSEAVGWVVINSGATLTVNSGGTLDVDTYVDADGNITVNSGGTLIVGTYLDADAYVYINSNSTGVALVRIDGSDQTSDIASGYYIQIAGTNDSDYGELRITQDHTIQGDGSINGTSGYALVSVADSMTLTSQVTVQGAMDIDNVNTSGTFNNEKLVHANYANGTIDVSTATISDSVSSSSSDPRWKVSTNSTSTLRFTDDATGSGKLVGDFDIDAGTLDIQEDVTTSGGVDQSGGTIQVASGKTFQAS